MKIVYIHRSSRSGGYSIENVFTAIATVLRTQGLQVIEYELKAGWAIFLDLIRLWRFRADIYHVTGDVNYLVILLPRRKTLLTIHDVGHYLFGLFGWRKIVYKWLWLLIPIRYAQHVTAVSEATKSDLVTHLSVAPGRVDVIGDCYDPKFSPLTVTDVASRPRVLQIGTGKHKNVPRHIHALDGTEYVLDIIGKINSDITTALQSTQLAFENSFDISQDELIKHYAAADIVSFVSTSEGFGMPIIEAQAMGKPLVTANRAPMSDVAGRGACLVDPMDTTSIRAGIDRLIQDDIFRARVIESGLKNVQTVFAVDGGEQVPFCVPAIRSGELDQ